MKKPAFIRFFGWAFWFLVSLGLAAIIARAYQVISLNTTAVLALAWPLALPCFVMWVIGSLVHAVSKSHAERQAQTLAQLMAQHQGQPAICGLRGPDGVSCDLNAGHLGAHRGLRQGPQAVQTSPLGLTGSDPRR